MKKYLIYATLFFGLILLFFSCKKSDLITYKGERLLYFTIGFKDSVSVNFSMLPDNVKDTILKVPVGLLGLQLNAATPYDVAIDEQLTTVSKDPDFELPKQYNFPTEKSTDTIRIKIMRAAKLADKEYALVLELKSTPEFNNMLIEIDKGRSYATKIRIFMTDVLKPTPKWANTEGVLGTEYYLGRFTKKKMQLMSELYIYFTFKELYDNIDQYRSYFGTLLNNYLKVQKAAGTPIFEDDGTLMEAGLRYK